MLADFAVKILRAVIGERRIGEVQSQDINLKAFEESAVDLRESAVVLCGECRKLLGRVP